MCMLSYVSAVTASFNLSSQEVDCSATLTFLFTDFVKWTDDGTVVSVM
jgi:hypothetical protein